MERNGDISVRDGVLKTRLRSKIFVDGLDPLLVGFLPLKKNRACFRARVTRGDVFRADVVDESRY